MARGHCIATLPADLPGHLRDQLLTEIEHVLGDFGAERVRVDDTVHSGIAIVADLPDDAC